MKSPFQITPASSFTLESAPDVLTVLEVGQLLRIGRNAAYELVANGRLHGAHIGRSVRVPKSAVVAFIEGQKGAPAG